MKKKKKIYVLNNELLTFKVSRNNSLYTIKLIVVKLTNFVAFSL